jgi:hypothetical protein
VTVNEGDEARLTRTGSMSQHREEKQCEEEEWGENDEEMVVLAFGDNGDGQIGVGHVAPPYNPLATPAPVRHPLRGKRGAVWLLSSRRFQISPDSSYNEARTYEGSASFG